MNTKIVAVAVAAIIAIAAVGVYVLMDDTEDNDNMNIIGRVNNDGSGIFLKEGTTDVYAYTVTEKPTEGYYLGGGDKWVVFNKDVWAGKVFGTPGAATIQHVQLNQIVSLMGLEFKQYTVGQTIDKNCVYYIPGVNNYDKFVSTLADTPDMVGAFMWEPQYSVALQDNCVGLATTNDMFPGHTCCTIGAQNAFIVNNEDITVRFLAAYIEAVNEMSGFIKAGEGEGYQKVIDVALDKVNMPSDMSEEEKIAAIESAFELVVYTYKDVGDSADPLADLRSDISNLAEEFYEIDQVKNSYSDLGFSSADELAESFVKSDYIIKAEKYQLPDEPLETANITVAVINGDIHQLVIHYGIAVGIFEDYGINITLSGQAGGPGVYTAMANGDAQFGFIGAPPMTINSMNSGNIESA